MTVITRRLNVGGASTFPPRTQEFVGLINATIAGAFEYKIGPITSNDGGATVTPGSGAVIVPGAGGTWDDVWVKDPALKWDGSQFVCYYAGYDGGGFRIGRATASAVDGTWTKYGSNPVIGFGGLGTDSQNGVEFPTVLSPLETHDGTWKMWALQYPNGADHTNVDGVTVGHWDSTDGLTWTSRGTVVDLGTAGLWYDFGVIPGAVIRVGSTYYLYVSGLRSNLLFSTGVVTTTDPATPAAYSTATEMANYAGNLTLGAWTWRSNLARTVIARGNGTYYVAGTVWNPTPADTEEASWAIETNSLTNWPAPSGLVITPPGSGWYGGSAENPTLIEAP